MQKQIHQEYFKLFNYLSTKFSMSYHLTLLLHKSRTILFFKFFRLEMLSNAFNQSVAFEEEKFNIFALCCAEYCQVKIVTCPAVNPISLVSCPHNQLVKTTAHRKTHFITWLSVYIAVRRKKEKPYLNSTQISSLLAGGTMKL